METRRTYTGQTIEDTAEAWEAEIYLSGAEAEYFERESILAGINGDSNLASILGGEADLHIKAQDYAACQLARVCAGIAS